MAVAARATARPTLFLVTLVAAGVLVRAPILRSGFLSDDYVLLSAIGRSSPLGNARWDLWSFYDGVPAHDLSLIHRGALPWWTEPTASHAFLRPLASMALDVVAALFGRQPAAYYAVLLAVSAWSWIVAGRIFQRLLPLPAATIALAVFVFHPLSVDPTEWVSAVHIPLATALVFTGWWWDLRFRLDGWRAGRFASVAAMVAGLAAGEAALGPLAYVALDAGVSRWRSKSTPGSSVAAPIVLGVAYVALYRGLHRGARGLAGYLDPAEHPWRVAAEVAKRLAAEGPRLFLAPARSPLATSTLAAAFVVLAMLAIGFDRRSLRACAFWIAGTTACALPAVLGPTDRALYPATLGSAAIVGLLLGCALDLARARSARNGPASASDVTQPRPLVALLVASIAALAAATVLVGHVAGGALANLQGARSAAGLAEAQERAVTRLAIANPEGTDVVILDADDEVTGPWGGAVYALSTGRRPRSWQALSFASDPRTIGRLDAATLEMGSVGGGPLPLRLYRDPDDHPLHVGDRVTTPRLVIEVVAVERGCPTRIRVHADTTFDDARFLFATRGEGGLHRVALPPVGMGVVVP